MSRPARSWSVYDFILIWLGGLVGTGVLFAIGTAFADANWAILLGLAGQYLGSLGVLWVLTRYKDFREIGLTIQTGDFFYIGLGLVLQLGVGLLFQPLRNLLFPDGRPQQEVANMIAEADATFLRVALVVAAVVLGPITEELTYRGILLRSLESRGRVFAIVVSSVVFTAVHVTGLGMSQLWRSAAVILPPLFLLGIILAWLTERHGRLGPAIFLHSGWNLLAALVLLLPPELVNQVS